MMHKVTIDDVRRDYKNLAAQYDTRWRSFNAVAQDWIVQKLAARQIAPQQIADLGCGTGALLARLAARYPQAVIAGFDASPEMLALAQRRLPQAAFTLCDIETALPARTFDLVLSVNVLHHLNDPAGHIAVLRRFCAENGAIFLCDFCLDAPWLRAADLYWRLFQPSYRRGFTTRSLQQMLRPYFSIADRAIVSPDRFWRLQIYRLTPLPP